MDLDDVEITGNITVTGDKMSITNCVFGGKATFHGISNTIITNCVFQNGMTITNADTLIDNDTMPFHLK